MPTKAEIIINGPLGQSFATVEFEPDGTIHPAMAQAALAKALNNYNRIEEKEQADAH